MLKIYYIISFLESLRLFVWYNKHICVLTESHRMKTINGMVNQILLCGSNIDLKPMLIIRN